MMSRTIFLGLPGQAPPPPVVPPTPKEKATYLRKELQECTENLDDHVGTAVCLLRQVAQIRSWTVLKRGDGQTFASFEQFCEWPRPHGLGFPFAKLRPYWEQALAAEEKGINPAKAVELAIVPVARQGNRTDASTSGHDVRKLESEEKKEGRLRAISRAPESVRDLYTKDLIPQETAAKLGPKSPTPEQAAKVAEARQEAERVVKEHGPPKDETEKRKLRKQVDKAVKRALGAPEKPSPKGGALRTYDEIAGAALALSTPERERLVRELLQSLEETGR